MQTLGLTSSALFFWPILVQSEGFAPLKVKLGYANKFKILLAVSL